MAGNQKRLIVAVNGGEEEYLKAFDEPDGSDRPDEIVFMRNVWFGPFTDQDDYLNGLSAYGQDVLFADPAAPSDFFIVRNEYAVREKVAGLLQDGFSGWKSIPELALPLDGITDPMHFMPLTLIERNIFPFVRKDVFFRDYREILEEGVLQSGGDVLEYIRNRTGYDEGIILKELISEKNMADLKKDLPLDRVISTRSLKEGNGSITKIALRLHLYYEDEAPFCRHYLESMPEGADIYVTVPNETKKAAAEKAFKGLPYRIEYRVIGNRGRDVAALLTGMKDVVNQYDLLCVVHDKKVTQVNPLSIGGSWGYMCFENLLANKIYVENVIAEFENDERLGMLQPPVPIHSFYYPVIGKGEWSGCADIAVQTAEMLGIHVDIDPDKEPVAPLGDMFWVRPKALKAFFDHDWNYEDFPPEPLPVDRTLLHAIERTYQFAVQQAGFYNAWTLTDEYARIYIDNLVYMNDENIREIMKRTGPGSLSHMLAALTGGSAHKDEDHTYDDVKKSEEEQE